jgi:hypothetical protein
MATISFKTTFNLSLTPKQFIFEDLSDYAGQGIAEADVNGCISEIIPPSGIPYYTNADFSDLGCDIQVAVDRVSKIAIPLPQTAGVVEPGEYTIKYKVYNKDAEEYYEITNTYTYSYERKTITITQDADCLSPRFTSTDTTDYSIAGATLTLIRQHVINFPFGSAGESLPISGPLATYSTSVFYNGTQTTEIGSSVLYVFEDGLEVADYLTGVKEILVACEDTCAIMCCIKANENKLSDLYISNRSEYNLLLPKFNLAVSYLVLIVRSQACGLSADMAGYLTKIKTLLGCTDDCCTEGDTPTQVIGLGNTAITVVTSAGVPISINTLVAGTTTTYEIEMDEAFVQKVNDSYNSIVAAGTNISSVNVVTNPDGSKTYTINAAAGAVLAAGAGISIVEGPAGTFTITNAIAAGDNIGITGTTTLTIAGKNAIVVAGAGITVTPSAEVDGVITYTVAATGSGSTTPGNGLSSDFSGTPINVSNTLALITGADHTVGAGEDGKYIFMFNCTVNPLTPFEAVQIRFQMRVGAVLTGIQRTITGLPAGSILSFSMHEVLDVVEGDTIDVVASTDGSGDAEINTMDFSFVKVSG